MFTGIIEAIGSVAELQQLGSDWRLTIDSGKLDLSDVVLGDSIAVNGCCLTVVELQKDFFGADVSNESMRCTALGAFKDGTPVNLEKAMLASGRLGGHIVSGHVDGVGSLIESSADGASVRLVYEAPKEIAKYIAGKGSICIDGTSLTVNEVSGQKFTVNDPILGLSGTIAQKKEQAFKWFIEEGYIDLTFFDDDRANVKIIKGIKRDYQDLKIKTHLAKK